MSFRLSLSICLMCFYWIVFGQRNVQMETTLTGVFQDRTLFIQNPYNRHTKEFCIEEVIINGRHIDANYNFSAIKIDFDGFDSYTPVNIKLIHKDSTCRPAIINPDAILFHTIFRFAEISLSDSVLYWYTKGERGIGQFEVEKLSNGIWIEQEVMQGTGQYSGEAYSYYPTLDEGANKYRVKYIFPQGGRVSYLFSREVELEFYPERVTFTPKSPFEKITFSRPANYEIYDKNNTLVLDGSGVEADVRTLRRGDYVIYFNGKYPGSFTKQ